MKNSLLLMVCLVLLTACSTKQGEITQGEGIDTQDLRRKSYDDFVTRRTLELEHMGGALAKNGVARTKALEEATARFGDVPAEWAVTKTWGKDADKAKAQAELNSQLDKMAHRKAD